MPKARKTLNVVLPKFLSGRTEWRRPVHAAAAAAHSRAGVKYSSTDKLALYIRLRVPARKMGWVDIDNRLKHIMDALQGLLAGEGKGKRRTEPIIIPNDHQVHRVHMEKRRESTKRTAGGGHLSIRLLSRSRGMPGMSRLR